MAWHIVEKFLEQVAEHSTLVGKFWITFFFVLRFLIVISIADNVFEDEQEEFVCNTLTPGCENVCFNEFSPLSLLRLWALQILFVALPSLIFIIYTAHKLTKVEYAKKMRKEKQEKQKRKVDRLNSKHNEKIAKRHNTDPPGYQDLPLRNEGLQRFEKPTEKEEEKDDEKKDDEKIVASHLDADTPSKLMIAYIAQVLFRLIIEILFIVLHFHLYVFKMWIPELFQCSRYPCPNTVECYISRPKEKTVLLWIMFGTSIVMMFVGCIELYHVGFTKMKEAWSTRHDDITKKYKVKNNMPTFGRGYYGGRYPRGYPQAVGIRVGYARSSISGGGNDIDGDQFI